MKFLRFGFALLFIASLLAILIWSRHGIRQLEQPASPSVVSLAGAADALPQVNPARSAISPPAQPGSAADPSALVFGLNGPVKISDVPAGRFLDELQAAAPEARERALETLGRLRVPIADVPHLHLGRRGDIFYACPMQSPEEALVAVRSQPPSALTAATPVSVTTPPVRHSRSGSSNVIYLDFNGHTVSGTSWNYSYGVLTYVCRPYDTDGDSTTFSDAEQAAMLEIWRRVAEDFSPFDVDVTTEEPASFNNRTLRALVTTSTDANGFSNPGTDNGASGVASLGIFNGSSTTYLSPAFVYFDRITGEANLAEVISHEIGHNFGLSHDGTVSPSASYYSGHGTEDSSWAPIMGRPYNKAVTQWSKGDYYSANNTQDDLALIGAATGAPSSVAGASRTSATPLHAVGGQAVATDTLLSSTADRYFSFSPLPGLVSFTATPVTGGNADLALAILDATGVVVAAADPADSRSVTLTSAAPLAAGAYYVRVRAAATGTPTENPPSGYVAYGSIGQYTLTGTYGGAAPVITSEASASIGFGHEFRYPIVTAGAASTYGATGLPPGLTIDAATGIISGRPNALGVFTLGLTAANEAGIGSATLTLTVTDAAPAIVASTAKSTVILPGGTATLGVNAFTANGSARYQWFRNGRVILGANTANYTANADSTRDYDAYWVEVTNDIGMSRSAPFFVRVAPALSRVQALIINNNSGQSTVPAGLGRVVAVAAGNSHSVALRDDGTLATWGATSSSLAGISDAAAVAAGYNLTAVLRADGTVALFPVGSGSLASAPTPPVNLGGVVAIALGYSHVLALKTDGTVVTWGTSAASSSVLSVPAGLSDVVAIAASGQRSMALKADGTVVSWGEGADLQPVAIAGATGMATGEGRSLVLKTGGPTVAWGSGAVAAPWLLPDGSRLGVSSLGFFALKPDGTVLSWGTSSTAALPPALPPVRQLSVGSYHVLALVDAAGESAPSITTAPAGGMRGVGDSYTFSVSATGPGVLGYQWRRNGEPINGATAASFSLSALQVSDTGSYDVVVLNHIGSTTSAATTLTVEVLPAITVAPAASVKATLGAPLTFTTAATSAYGPLTYQWKKDNRPIAGATGPTLSIPSFSAADAGAYVLEITDAHGLTNRTLTFVLPDFGPTMIRAWGPDYYHLTTPPADLPRDCITMATIEGAAIGLRSNGCLAVWGDGASAGLRATLATVTDAVAIATRGALLQILHSDGRVSTIGGSGGDTLEPYRQVIGLASGPYFSAVVLADGTVRTFGNSNAFQVPASLNSVSALAVGSSHLLALRTDGTVTAFGSNYSGQCNVPGSLSGVVAIAAAGDASFALKSDGGVVAWGSAAYGLTSIPSDLGEVAALSTGYYWVLALRRDGTPRIWGSSDYTNIPESANGIRLLSTGNYTPAFIRSLSEDTAPIITRQPAAIATGAGMAQRFSVSATGAGPLSYQWRKNGVVLPDCVQAYLEIFNPQPADAGSYDVIVSNHIGSVTSSAATLTLVTPPTITAPPPQRFLAALGQQVRLTVAASSAFGPLTYQWKKNNRPLSGATAATYEITSFTAADAGAYTIEIVDSRGAISRATTFVAPNFGPTQVKIWSDSGSYVPPAGLSDVYALRPFNTAILRSGRIVGWEVGSYGTAGAFRDPALPISDISYVDALRVSPAYSSATAWVGLRADGVIVGSTNAPSDSLAANIPSTNRSFIAIAPGLIYNTGLLALATDGRVYFRTSGSDFYPLETGEIAISAMSSGSFHTALLRVDGTVGVFGTDNSYGQRNVPAGLSNVVAVAAGDSHTLALKADGTVVAWGYNGSYQCDVPQGLADVVAVGASSNQSFALKADGTLLRWGGGFTAPIIAPGGFKPALAFLAGNGACNILCSAAGDAAPTITTQPAGSGLRSVGESLTLQVSATGAGPLAYQWRCEGVVIPGATTSTLALASLQLSEAGRYDVVVSNFVGSVISESVNVQVAAPPALSSASAARQVVAIGSPLGVTVEASSSYGPLTYQWKKNNRPLTGATTPTLTIPAVSPADGGAYTLEVVDTRGLVSRHTVFVLPSEPSQVRAWGTNSYNQATPPSIAGAGALAVAAGTYTSYALLPGGSVAAWGRYSSTAANARAPATLTNAVALAAGTDYALGLRDDGTVLFWSPYTERVLSAPFREIIAVSTTSYYGAALRSDGAVLICNSNGDLLTTIPATDGPFVAIAAGVYHVLALRLDGTVRGWTTESGASPSAVAARVPAGLAQVAAIAAGNDSSLALRADGSVVSWGRDASLQAIGPGGASAINAGVAGAGAVLADGSLSVWSSSSAPIRTVPADLGVVRQFALGASHGLALVSGVSAGVAPAITQSPVSRTRAAGDYAYLEVTATGTTPLSYQWRKDGVAIAGATARSLLISPLTATDAASYDVVVSNAIGSAVSAAAVLAIDAGPQVTAVPPARIATPPGSPVTLSASATSGYLPLSYQWKKDNRPLAGETSPTLTLAALTAAQAGAYTLEITDARGAITRVTSFVLLAPSKVQVRLLGYPGYYAFTTPPVNLGDGAVAASLTANRVLVTRADGTIANWAPTSATTGRGFTTLNDFSDIVATAYQSGLIFGLRANGAVVYWGNDGSAPVSVSGLSDVIAIRPGLSSAMLALRSNGTLAEWGGNGNFGSWIPSNSSTEFKAAASSLRDVVDLASNPDPSSAVAIRLDGSAAAWTNTSSTLVSGASAARNMARVAVANYAALGLRTDGAISVWGDTSYSIGSVPGGSDFIAVAAGDYHGLALRSDGTVAGWGDNNYGQTSLAGFLSGTFAIAAYDNVSLILRDTSGDTAPSITAQPLNQVATFGTNATFTVSAGGAAPFSYQWRRNGVPLPGATEATLIVPAVAAADVASYDVVVSNHAGSITSNAATLTVNGPAAFAAAPAPRQLIAPGAGLTLTHTLSAPAPGAVYRWYHDNRLIAGAIGLEYTIPAVTAETAGAYTLAVTTSNGITVRNTTFVLLASTPSYVRAWGSNDSGQLKVPNDLGDAIAVAAGASHGLALRADGTVRAWGGNSYNQCSVPANLDSVVAIAAGSNHSLALRANGTVVAWGSSVGTVPLGLSEVVAIAADGSRSIALKSDGTVNVWGDSSSIRPPANATDLVAVAVGSYHAVALKSDGTPIAWSYTSGNNNAEVVPAELSDVVAIAASGSQSAARTRAGRLVVWGSRASTVALGSTPISLFELGSLYGLARTTSGDWLSWGDTSTGTRNVPADLGNVLALSGSDYFALALCDATGHVAPSITTQPLDKLVAVGDRVVFAVTAAGPGTLSYQWRYNGVPISGATAAAFLLPDVTSAQAGGYDVVVTNHIGSVISRVATLALGQPPTFTAKPANRSLVALGQSLTLTGAGSTDFGPITYRWKKNNRVIAGAASATLTLTNFTDADAGAYTLEATDSRGLTARSTSFVLPDYGATEIVAFGESSRVALNPIGLSNAVAVRAGSSFDTVLRADGSVMTWGGSSYSRPTPSILSDAVAIAPGSAHLFALRADGTVVGWSTSSTTLANPPVYARDVISIATGYSTTTIVRSDGSVFSWRNSDASPVTIPVIVEDVSSVATNGDGVTAAVTASGAVVGWGSSYYGLVAPPTGLDQVASLAMSNYAAFALRSDNSIVGWGSYSSSLNTAPAGSYRQIATADTRAGAVTVGGALTFWGSSGYGSDTPPAGTGDYVALSLSTYHTLALRRASADAPPVITVQPAAGVAPRGGVFSLSVVATSARPLVYQWRRNGTELTGATAATLTLNDVQDAVAGSYDVVVRNAAGSVTSTTAVVTVDSPPVITSAPDARQLIALGTARTLTFTVTTSHAPLSYRWKKNNRILAGATASSLAFSNFAAVDAGAYTVEITDALGLVTRATTFVLPDFGRTQIRTWGSDGSNQLKVPANLGDAVAVSAGGTLSLALRADGSVIAWGSNNNGATGVPADLTDVVAVSAGEYSSLVLKQDGTVAGWGSYGNVPTGLRDVIAIAAGSNKHLALKSDGTVVAWSGTTLDAASTLPAGLSDIVAIAAGRNHQLALKSDGTVLAWGANAGAVVPAGLTGVVAISAGYDLSVALKADGTVVAWGQYANSTPTGLRALDCGDSYTIAQRSDGNLQGWGFADYAKETTIPTDLGVVRAFSAGADHVVVLRDANADTAPELTAEPISAALNAGVDYTFSVSATGIGPLSFQWMKNGQPITGAIGSTLTLTEISAADVASYSVRVSNHVGSRVSAAAALTLLAPPNFTATPSRRVAAPLGQPVILHASAVGASPSSGVLSYQWKKNNRPIVGATTSAYSIPSFTFADAGAYTLEVTDALGAIARVTSFVLPSDVSTQIRVWGAGAVTPPATLTDAVKVCLASTSSGGGLALRAGGRLVSWGANPTVPPVGLDHVVDVAISAPGYAIALRDDQTILTFGSSVLPTPPPAARDVVMVAASVDAFYALRADGRVIAWSNYSPSYDYNSAPPANLRDSVGLSAYSSYAAALTQAGDVAIWGRNGRLANSSDFRHATSLALGYYHLLGLNADGTVVGWGFSSNYYGEATIPADLGPVSGLATGNYNSFAVRTDGTVRAWGCTDYALTTVPGGLANVVAVSASDVAVAALRIADTDAAPTITASPASVSAGLDSPFTLNVTATGAVPLYYQWRRDGVAITGAVASSYSVARASLADAGHYDVVVSNHRGLVTSSAATVTLDAPPDITTAPAPRNVVHPGQSLTLSVSASTTTGPLTYRWKKNNRLIPGASAASYSLSAATYAEAGAYTVEVIDSAGRTSRRTCFVLVAPTATHFIGFGEAGGYNLTTLPTSVTGPLLSVVAAGSANLALKVDGTVASWGYSGNIGSPPAGLSNVVALSSDGNYVLALKSDGTVVAWGWSSYGATAVPTGLANVIAISASYQQALALKSDGSVVAWGNTTSPYNPPVGLTDVVGIHAASDYSLAVKSDGTLVGWGTASYAQLSSLPTTQGFTKAQGAYYAALGLRTDGTLVGWGSNGNAQLNIPVGLSGVVDFALTNYHVLALKSDGTVAAWGFSYTGATMVPGGLTSAYAISAGGDRSIVLRDASSDTAPIIAAQPQAVDATEGTTTSLSVVATGPGTLAYQWRRDGVPLTGATSSSLVLSGVTPAQAGSYDVVISNHVGSVTSAAAALTVRGLPVVTTQSSRRVAAVPGGLAQFSVTATGTGTLAYQWRRNGIPLVGQTSSTLSLSNLTRADGGWYVCAITDENGTRLAPPQWLIVAPARTQTLAWGANSSKQTEVPSGIIDAIAVAAGGDHSLALRRDGSLVGWGYSSHQPGSTAGLAGVVAVAADGANTYTLHDDGTLRRWGDYSQLTLPAGAPVVALSASSYTSVALRADGTAVTWTNYSTSATIVSGEAVNLSAVAAAASFCVGLKTDGTLVQWGSASQSIPAGLTGIRAIAAGYNHALALKSDGTVVAWGDNSSGQTTVPANLAGVVAISATNYASFAVKSDGTVVAWGRNTYGECNVSADAANVFALAPAAAGNHMLALRDVSADVAPALATAPSSLVAAVGERASLSVAATGAGPFTYTWRKNGVVMTGATAALLMFDPVVTADAGSYTVEVANHIGSVVSAPAVLTVENAPTFTVRPVASITGTPGSALTLTGAATSSYLPIVYQWNKDNRPITGATSATFTIPSFTNADAGAYTLVATDTRGHKIYAVSFVLPSYGPVQVRSLNGYLLPPATLGAVIDISGGYSTNLALRADKTIATWGGGLSTLPAANDFVRIASTNSHGLALHSDGTIAGFGYGSYGEITIPARAVNVVAIATGIYHSLALRADGSVIAWGRNDYRQCDVPAGLANVVAIAASGNLSAAVKADGTVVVWGDAANNVTSVPAGLSGVTAVALGTSHALALKSDGTVVAWGSNSYGQANVPSGLAGIVEISASNYTSAARSAASVISVWGSSSSSNNTSGLGTVLALRSDGDGLMVLRDVSSDTVPVISSQPASVTVAAGYSTSFSVSATGNGPFSYQWRFNGTPISGAITANYYVYNLGATNVGSYDVVVSNHVGSVTSNAATLTITGSGSGVGPLITAPATARIVGTLGQPLALSLNATGTGALTYQWFHNNRPLAGATAPTLNLASFTRSDAGAYTLAVTDAANATSRRTLFVLPPVTSSFLLGAGDDSFGQSDAPLKLADAIAVAAGELHSLVLRADGTITAWGANFQGQATVPATLTDVVAIAAGSSHSLALRADGSVTGLGSYYGALVTGGANYRNIIAIAAGANISVGLRDDGSVASWSNNYYTAPTLTNAVAISAGSDHGLALMLDGTVAAWGSTTYGQTTIPTALTGVTAIASGYNHNLALKSDGTIVAWGRNQSSQLNVPASASAYVAIRAGGDWSAAQTTDGNWHVWGDPSPTSPVVLTNLNAAPFAESWGARHSLRLYDLADFALPLITRHPQSEIVAIGGSLDLSATAAGAGPLSYQWLLDGAPITDTATRTGTQTATLHLANLTAAGNYSLLVTNPSGSAASLTAVVAIKPNAQTIAFATLPACTYTAAPIALVATASSGLPVSFEIVSGPAILTGGQLTLTGVGTVVVRATQSGDATYAPATPVDRSFTVGRATAAITLANLVHTYNGTARSATAATSPGGLAVAITYEGRGFPPSATGVYSVYAVIDDPRYTGTAFATLEIMGSAQSITFPALPDRAFPVASVPLGATASSGLPVTYTLVSGPARLAGGQLVIVGPGVVTVRASQSGDANYYAAPDVERSFEVVTGLSNWSAIYFTAEEQADPAISGPNADPDDDGIPNLLEYALGMDPRRAASTGLPVATQEAGSWTYTFTRPTDRSDVGYSVMWSNNLTTWSDGATLTRIATIDGMETWQATYPAASAPNCFFRLVVTH